LIVLKIPFARAAEVAEGFLNQGRMELMNFEVARRTDF
jgi:hypothetical protein